MRGRKWIDFAFNRPYLIRLPSVKTGLLIKNKTPGGFFKNIVIISFCKSFVYLFSFRILRKEIQDYLIKSLITVVFICSRRLCCLVAFLVSPIPYLFPEIFIIYFMAIYSLNLCSKLFIKFHLGLAMNFDGIMSDFKGFKHFGFRNFLHFTLNHQYVFVCCTNH